MPKFRKRPVVVEAEQWWPGKRVDGVVPIRRDLKGDKWVDVHGILTLEGVLYVSPGDWIVTGVKGEKYPVKPDVFEATYEPVEEPGRRQERTDSAG